MKRTVLLGMVVCGLATGGWAQTYVDLSPLFDTDAVLETGGTGEGLGLDDAGRRIDAGTLPVSYQDGGVNPTQDGRTRFKFAQWKQAGLDAALVNGQVLDVPDANYGSVDLALISAPGAFANPFGQIEFRYSDGSKDLARLGPVPGWFNSPAAFDHTLYRFTDDSEVQTIASFATDFGAAEAEHIVQERGNGNSGGNRFVDAAGYVLYRIGDLAGLPAAKLAVTVGNNFVVSLATTYNDPDASTTEGYTVVANSMELYGGFDHHALGNLKAYEFDLAPFLAAGTGEIYILLTDASPQDGWGPFLQQIRLYTGSIHTFETVLDPEVDTSKATVYAMFRTADAAETPFLYDNSGSGPSNRGHRFADGNGSITYRFDLPDTVSQARLTMDLANNFVVSLAGASDVVKYQTMVVGAANEGDFLVDSGGSNLGGDFRFADGNAYMIYQFDLPDDVTTAYAQIHIGNQFVIAAAKGVDGEFQVEKDWVAETGEETRDNSNLNFYTVDLAPYLVDNPSKIVQFKFYDGLPSDGWGPFLKSISIVNKLNAGEVPVLSAQDLFGEDIRSEYNKGYYTVDLAPVLANNPTKEVFVKFTDGSKSDGWGPGIFWMAVYTGEIEVQSDRLVFTGLKTTLADPVNYSAAMVHRRYPLHAGKTLSGIAFPSQPASESSKVYLLGATLNGLTQPPALKSARLAGGRIRLSWPASQTGYRLQSTLSLGSTAAWSDVPDAPQTVGDEWVVEAATTDAARYYRLIR